MNLLKNVQVREVMAPAAMAANTDKNSDIIDMSGWDGILFILPITDCLQNGVAKLQVEQDDANADGGMAALTGASATVTSAANDDLNDKLLVVDVYRPAKRYVQAVATSATANVAFGNMIAILYQGRKAPVALDTTVLAASLAATPAEAA